ncbi:YafY family transcriptional regulator [Defluviimonas sp. WL0002]|uniref:YafY family transcriptional regulator n=1 Tax=Albidovulum marisflavi TaxID=2984159 RepID=A0ABT2ZAY4_9RHOB|nr:YafY family protein [Defluviimonas sp. WL0002]MCV2868225.1 YafY family transcriptional regulator [Defluviimonas sp. WL0002]
MKPNRMLQIIALFRSEGGALTAEALAARLGASRRTIYRDISALQAMGVPIDGTAGQGYVLRPGFDLPPIGFSPAEIEAIIVGLALLPASAGGLSAAARSVAAKIQIAQPPKGRRTLPRASSSTAAEPALLRRAMREERRLAIAYRGQDGAISHRAILPVASVTRADAAFVVAWCELAEDLRLFRMEAIEDCILPGGGFAGRGAALRAELDARTFASIALA